MIEYRIVVILPLATVKDPANTPIEMTLGRFNYDPFLQVGEQINISDWNIGFGGGINFSAQAEVKRISKYLVPGSHQKDALLQVRYLLEIADKEDVPKVCELLIALNPNSLTWPALTDSEPEN